MSEEKKSRNYKLQISEELQAGVYANAVSVHFNSNECVIDMAYNIPNMPEPVIKIVSRVNMSHKTAESFLKVLSNSLLDWKNKTRDQQEKENNE